jgi:hypothetical protein
MGTGNSVVAYQANEGAVGLAYLNQDGYRSEGSNHYDAFGLKPTPRVWLDHPVPYREIRDLPDARRNIEFCKVKQGTVFRVSLTGFKQILGLMLKHNPKQRKDILAFLSSDRFDGEANVVAADADTTLTRTNRAPSIVQRIIRDSVEAKSLKKLYGYKCQVPNCRNMIELPDGKRYAEVHHLKPVGKPHNGKEGKPNMVVLCPHHHAMFDLGAIAINPNTLTLEHWNPRKSEHGSKLIRKHVLSKTCLSYQYQKLFKGSRARLG